MIFKWIKLLLRAVFVVSCIWWLLPLQDTGYTACMAIADRIDKVQPGDDIFAIMRELEGAPTGKEPRIILVNWERDTAANAHYLQLTYPQYREVGCHSESTIIFDGITGKVISASGWGPSCY